ncbi:hypothetical protein [Dyadobacter sp. MSC1_007]|jgi:hypothetical protein|uniref:hypothetical protein n=1 Tax=Dyadobacter sp. MSC1_007 TaxID=2909264 RepID=UPI00202E9901|nr:hypothetical protein [Dyadobacter sp. MSC1_007]
MNKLYGSLLVVGPGLLGSCEKKMEPRSDTFCGQARFVRRYHCAASESIQVVEFKSPNPLATQTTRNDTSGTKYYGAMLDLPDSLAVSGKTFYMQFHRDKAREVKAKVGYCTMEYTTVEILVCEGVSQSCQ